MFEKKSSGFRVLRDGAVAASLLGGAVLLTPGEAAAQQTLPVITPTTSVNEYAPEVVKNFGKDLTDTGVYVTALYSGQMAANTSGGERQGIAYAARLTLGTALDMGKLAGIEGGTFHIVITDDTGQNLSAHYVNTDLSQQSLFSGPEALQLSIFTYEQRLFNNTLDINFGRTDLAFLDSELYCDFESRGNCGRPAATFKTVSASLFPTAVWGGRILYAPTPNFYGKIGIYQPNPDLKPAYSHGFDWGIKTSGPAGGFVLPVEIGYTSLTPGAVIPNRYDFGVIDSEEQFSAPFDTAQHPLHDGRVDLYVQAQQFVYQTKANSPRGIYLFGYGIYGASGQTQVANYQLTGGAVWQGPFESRPYDRAGAMFNYYHMNSFYLNSLYATRLKAKGTAYPWSNQTLIEVNYTFQLTKWLQLQPDFQYLIHPDGLGYTPFPKYNLPNAVIAGVQFNINLATMAGLQSYPLAAQQDN